MKYFISTVFPLVILFVLFSCKKADEAIALAPTNLVIKTEISTDGSGTVVFTATADGAVSFDYEYGNGVAVTVPSGTVTYKYTTVGTNTYPVTVTAKGSSGLSAKKTVQITVAVNSVVPGIFWSEEFNTDGAPDPAKWGYDLGTGSGGWGNSELQYYTSRSENVIVQGGVLKIKAIKESYSGSAYTSARIITMNKFAFTYGKVEVRAKLPVGVGTWPAAWMLGSNLNTAIWPACGEIDIMEHKGSELNKIFGTLHYPGHSGGSANGSTFVIANATTEFHIYAVEWTAASIMISVDGVVFHTVPNTAAIPFNHDFFIILNVAMGGTFGGAVDPAFTNATMEVDYVRVTK
jgi:beta-glucanase (GH16 family)